MKVPHHLPSSITAISAPPARGQPDNHGKHVTKDYSVGGPCPLPAPPFQRKNQKLYFDVLHQDTLNE